MNNPTKNGAEIEDLSENPVLVGQGQVFERQSLDLGPKRGKGRVEVGCKLPKCATDMEENQR
jgi:hypothetical protein